MLAVSDPPLAQGPRSPEMGVRLAVSVPPLAQGPRAPEKFRRAVSSAVTHVVLHEVSLLINAFYMTQYQVLSPTSS